MSQTVLERPTVEEAPPTAWTKEFPPLTAQDRCDARTTTVVDGQKTFRSCGAQAFFRAILPSGQLLFCGHCLGAQPTKSEVRALRRQALLNAGAKIQDDYASINLKPTESSEAKGF